MSLKEVTTAREALLAELLQDIDSAIQRFESADQTLAKRVEDATKEGANRALLSVRLNFQSVIEANASKLTDAARHAAAMIGNQLNDGTARMLCASETVGKARRYFLVGCIAGSFMAAALGGILGALLPHL